MSTRLVMNFSGTNGDFSMSYGYVKNNASGANLKALVNSLITNGSIFANQPLSIKTAKLVTTSETPIDLSE